jgi:hypothetical protein
MEHRNRVVWARRWGDGSLASYGYDISDTDAPIISAAPLRPARDVNFDDFPQGAEGEPVVPAHPLCLKWQLRVLELADKKVGAGRA